MQNYNAVNPRSFVTMTVFVPKQFDIKLNSCCNEIKFELNWHICSNTTDAVKNFDVIKSVSIKRVHSTVPTACKMMKCYINYLNLVLPLEKYAASQPVTTNMLTNYNLVDVSNYLPTML